MKAPHLRLYLNQKKTKQRTDLKMDQILEELLIKNYYLK